LGFFGLIREWVDLELLASVARRRPDWHIVLLGDSTIDLSPYQNLPNIHFLGRKRYEELPAYCKQFDVGLIPFKVNELTRAVNPIKLREYLAAGLPVVSTPLPEISLLKKRCVYVADTADGFIEAVELALAVSSKERFEQSLAMARETWAAKIDLICQHLDSRYPPGISEDT